MLFEKPDDFVRAPRHAVTVFGMSGVGKTRLSALLQADGWFHYSVDYRIGTRYMGEFIVDNFKPPISSNGRRRSTATRTSSATPAARSSK
jgi:hypothetical protein